MLPKSSKHCIIPTAKKVGVEEKEVKAVINHFYAKVRESLSNMDHYNLLIVNLGTFRLRPKELEKIIENEQRYLKKFQNAPGTIREQHVKERLDKLYNVREMFAENKNKKRQFYKNKTNGFNKDLESSETNS